MIKLLPPDTKTCWITNPTNVRYLTGLVSSNAQLLITPKKTILFTDGRYLEAAQKLGKKHGFSVINWQKAGRTFFKKHTIQKSGIEEHYMTVAALKKFKKMTGAHMVETKMFYEKIRAIKTAQELTHLRTAQKITDQILHILKSTLRTGDTEESIAKRIKVYALENGAEDVSFEPIVAFGAHGAIPHYRPANTKLRKGDMILIDMGVKYKGYCSDMTRTFFTAQPTPTQATIYQKVLDAQEAAIKKVKPEIKIAVLDTTARKSMGKDAQYFIHALGHGIGLDIHELPGVSNHTTEILQENMVITVEPGIYIPGKIGVRIEDMGRVTKKGYENFTKSPKNLSKSIIRIR